MKKQLLALISVAAASSGFAITLGQVDTFEDGTLQNWQGNVSHPPINVVTGGPRGNDDNYLRIASGPGLAPNLAAYNMVQWSGDWNAAGVNAIEVHLRNEGATALSIRAVWFGQAGTRFTSTKAFLLPPDGVWYKVVFPARESDVTRVLNAGESWAQVLGSLSRFMIRHDAGTPSSGGEAITGQLGIDNVEASNKGDLQPVNYVKVRGNETGTFFNLLFSDDLRMEWRPGVVFSQSQAPAEFTVDAFAPNFTNPSAMSFNIEGSASSVNVRRQIELLNHGTSTFDVVVPFTASATSEGLVTTNIPGFANYIHGTTGLIRARIAYKAFGPVFAFPWVGRIDRIYFRLTP